VEESSQQAWQSGRSPAGAWALGPSQRAGHGLPCPKPALTVTTQTGTADAASSGHGQQSRTLQARLRCGNGTSCPHSAAPATGDANRRPVHAPMSQPSDVGGRGVVGAIFRGEPAKEKDAAAAAAAAAVQDFGAHHHETGPGAPSRIAIECSLPPRPKRCSRAGTVLYSCAEVFD
jgi:hypothetical protein